MRKHECKGTPCSLHQDRLKLRRIKRRLSLCLALLIGLSSCGDSHTAKSHVREFVKDQMGQPDVDYISWSDIDSTKHLTDSTLQVMRATAASKRMVKKDATYTKPTPKLNIISLRYAIDKDTLMATFYLDDKLTGIVGVKSNPVTKP